MGPVWIALYLVLASLAALGAGVAPRALGYLGVLMAATGLATVAPALELVGAVFGLGLIVWFAWYGMLMLREPTAAAVPSIVADGSPASG